MARREVGIACLPLTAATIVPTGVSSATTKLTTITIAVGATDRNAPKLLLMDEPFASVDAQTRFGLEDLALSVHEKFGMTVVFVTHGIDESVYVSDRVNALSPSPCTVQRDIAVPLTVHAIKCGRGVIQSSPSCAPSC
jgi:ABC-type nitrate/sulfonate/bicarbonate transport system ATPase subunit